MSLLLPCSLLGQELEKIAKLPKHISESSGMVYYSSENIWLINDSGDDPLLYQINGSGELLRTLEVSNAQNTDWEDLTKDAQGNIYIGDFGNNLNKRQDLVVYKIPNPNTHNSKSTLGQIIRFNYEDQQAYPPKKEDLNFDCEAMVWLRGSLFLFTKNRNQPFDGKCKVYSIPAEGGYYRAKLKDSVLLGDGSRIGYQVTGAALSPDQKTLALLGYKKAWIFTDFKGDDFLKGDLREIEYGFTQKEALDFSSAGQLIIGDEKLKGVTGRNLFKLDLKLDESPYKKWDLKIKQKLKEERYQVSFKLPKAGDVEIYIKDENKNQVFQKLYSQLPMGKHKIIIESSVIYGKKKLKLKLRYNQRSYKKKISLD